MSKCMRCKKENDLKLCKECAQQVKEGKLFDMKLNRLLWGLKLMRLHGPVAFAADGGAIKAGPDSGEGLPEDYHLALLNLGWHWHEQEECYYVFAS